MQAKKRAFLKQAALLAAGASVALGSAKITRGIDPKEFDKDKFGIKSSSGKKDEVLYKRSPEWELFYKQAK
ncbi:MAG: Tat pathway signal protein [Campylobacter sp.]|nr:Tat pathway signal protein [Campylobacter sp.]